jgi:peptidoglycan/LPS O-acetylase OafA/YrhL
MLVVYMFFSDFSNGNRGISLLTSLTLIPDGNPALSVAWTLSFELCFYILFSISFFSRKAWNYFVLIWLLAIIVFTYSPISSMSFLKKPFFRMVFSTYNIEFILGFFLALLIVRKIKLNFILVFFALIISLISFFYCTFSRLYVFNFDMNLLFSIGAFFIIYIAISYYNFKINKTAVMMMLGNATYSIYLVHNPLQMILIRLFPNVSSVSGVIVILILVLVFSGIFGYLYYLVFEKKVINGIKSKLIK